MKLIVTGSGRCGTRWFALLLTALGIPVTHEIIYGRDGIDATAADEADVEVSWLALTYPLADTTPPMIGLARHPLSSIASLIDCGVFTRGDGYTDGMRRVLGDIWTGVPLIDACRWWVSAYTDPRLQTVHLLEEVTNNETALRAMLEPYGIPLSESAAWFGLSVTSLDRHYISERLTTLTWDDLPPAERLAVRSTALTLGYAA